MEQPVNYDKDEYPNGLNAIFTEDMADSLAEKYGNGNGRFENPKLRDIARNHDQVCDLLKLNGLGEGSIIVDVGSGTGLFLDAFADIAEKVYACDISEGFVTLLNQKVSDSNYGDTVSVLHSTEQSLNIEEPQVADLVFICDVYHHFTYPETVMKDIRNILKETGRVVMIDFHRDSSKISSKPAGWVEKHVRADQDTFRNEVLDCGFKLVDEPVIETMEENYVMVFEKN
eukprot:TRINITY_DN8100_c0_g1_i1.p1 TRINITY_DN8100_c0_g1~~TRINITY_DN8100_c0_g1_i1.p1  ORF type:complete len:240 (+),score=53.63 TRINITY_DN8100_c0_g1_i1:35-721(+)